ncbi:hypothetical protein ONZ45_g17582 [Pleurotus djamor]|nr:hypothetical protein ONZ45_g17582 [Pleurotus djamor]
MKHARSTTQRKLKQAVHKFGDRAIEKAAPQAGTRISEAKQELRIRRNAARKELDKFLGQEEEPNDTQEDDSTVRPAGETDAPNPNLKAYKCPHPGGKCGNTKQVLEDDVLRKRRDVDEDFEGDRRCNTCIQAGRTCNGSGCYRCNPCSDKGSACSHSKGHTSATKRPRGTEKTSRQRACTTATPKRVERPIRQLPKRAAKPSVGSLSEEKMESRPVVRNKVDLSQPGQVSPAIQSEDILRMDRTGLEEVIRKENQRFTSLTVEIQDCYARTTTAMECLRNLPLEATKAQSVFVEIPVPVARLRNIPSDSFKALSSSVGDTSSGEDEEEWGGITEEDEYRDDEMVGGDSM